MKINEAPEKSYVNFHFIETHPERHQPLVTKQGINKYDIEYTRTDIFIKKACEELKQLMYDSLMYQGRLERDKVIDSFIEDFKERIKGE